MALYSGPTLLRYQLLGLEHSLTVHGIVAQFRKQVKQATVSCVPDWWALYHKQAAIYSLRSFLSHFYIVLIQPVWAATSQ